VTRPAHGVLTLAFGATVALTAIAASNADWPGKPGAPGYVAPWNRVTEDTVVDLAPGERSAPFELRGTLHDGDHEPLAHVLVYVYHADLHGNYGTKAVPEIPSVAGCVRSGPRGGFIVRSLVPGTYAGGPHIHFEVVLPGRGRCASFLNLRPDPATGTLPGAIGVLTADHYHGYVAVVHRDPDGVYRTDPVLHVADWTPAPGLDSLHAAAERKYERAPWRTPRPTSR